eukprot:gene11624-8278_t
MCPAPGTNKDKLRYSPAWDEVKKGTNISTHVLDTATGFPAGGLRSQLRIRTNALDFTGEEDFEWQEVAMTETDRDGRARFFFDINPGIYQLRFCLFQSLGRL